MFKKIINSILLLILAIWGVLGIGTQEAKAALDASLLFDQTTVSASIGQNVTLIARIDPGTNDVGGAELDVTFNPAVLRLDSITRSTSFNITLGGPTIDNTGGSGSIDVGLLTDPATYVENTSDIATFSFTTLSAATNSPVSFALTSDASAMGEYVVVTRTGSQVTVASGADVTLPTVSAFVIPSSSTSFTVPITTFTATDNIGVTGYKLTETSSAPTAEASGWTASAPTSYYFDNAGLNTLYAWVKDAAGNVSASLNDAVVITVSESGEDITPPSIYNGVPTGRLSSSTTFVELSVLTDEASTCKYSTTENIAYDQMTLTFGSTGGTSHFQRISDLDDDRTYKYYVRCKDEAENVNNSDYLVTFSIKEKSSSKDEDEKKPKRKINNSKSSIRRGETLVQSGKRFSKNADVLLYFSKSDGGYYAPKKVTTSSSGKFSVSYKVNKSAGKYKWYAVDVNSGKKSKTKEYTVR